MKLLPHADVHMTANLAQLVHEGEHRCQASRHWRDHHPHLLFCTQFGILPAVSRKLLRLLPRSGHCEANPISIELTWRLHGRVACQRALVPEGPGGCMLR